MRAMPIHIKTNKIIQNTPLKLHLLVLIIYKLPKCFGHIIENAFLLQKEHFIFNVSVPEMSAMF